MAGSGSLGKNAGASAKLWSKADRHMQCRLGLLKQMKKGAPFSIPLHCLLSNSQHSAGHFARGQAAETTCTPDGRRHTLTTNHINASAQKDKNKLFF